MKLLVTLACIALGLSGCAFLPSQRTHDVTDASSNVGILREGQVYRLTKDALTDGLHIFGEGVELAHGMPVRAIGSTLNQRDQLLPRPRPVKAGTRLSVKRTVWEDVVTVSAFRVEFEVLSGIHAGRRLSIFNGPEWFILGSDRKGTVRLNPEWFSLTGQDRSLEPR